MKIIEFIKTQWAIVKPRLRLFIFNRQEFMSFTVWHILAYLAIWVLVAYIIIWVSTKSILLKYALFSFGMVVVPAIFVIHQFWRRFYRACIASNKRQAFVAMLHTLLHYFFVTAPLWVDIMLFIVLPFVAGQTLNGSIALNIGMFLAGWLMLYLFAAAFLLLSLLPILLIASIIYFCINFRKGTQS